MRISVPGTVSDRAAETIAVHIQMLPILRVPPSGGAPLSDSEFVTQQLATMRRSGQVLPPDAEGNVTALALIRQQTIANTSQSDDFYVPDGVMEQVRDAELSEEDTPANQSWRDVANSNRSRGDIMRALYADVCEEKHSQ